MPKSSGGLLSWLIGTLIVVAVGIAILSRVPAAWSLINKSS